MIAAISLMRRRDDVTLVAFRRHWLDVHGPLVCRFPALRHYVQDHVITSPACNAAARDMRIDGFPILTFDNDADRLRAHESAAMAACNVDSRLFIGAVSRVICEPAAVLPMAAEACPIRLIALLPGDAADDGALDRSVASVRGMLGLCGLLAYRVLQQGPAPNSTIPHLPVSVAGIVELGFGSLVELEEAAARNVSTTLIQPGLKFRLDSFARLSIADCCSDSKEEIHLWIYGQRKKGVVHNSTGAASVKV